MTTRTAKPVCLVTGARGYLGGRATAFFVARGWDVRELTREPQPGADRIRFVLGEELSSPLPPGAEALVHCAYDFDRILWDESFRINVAGTELLLAAAKAAGVRRIVVISSISAFEGCRSVYGRTKLAIEKCARRYNAFILRPGLIFGEPPGAMYGRLVKQVDRFSRVPLIGGGQIQYLVHEHDLCEAVLRCAEGRVPPGTEPILLANEQPWTVRQLLEAIAAAQGKRLGFVPVAWRPVWMAMKAVEAIGLRLSFRSDSLLSLMNQNPHPSFELKRQLNLECRPFAPGARSEIVS